MTAILTYCQEAAIPEKGLDLALTFTVVGGLWAAVTFVIEYLDNRFKRKVELLGIVREYNKDLRIWADQVIDLMTETGHLCDLDPSRDKDFFNKRHKLKSDLSSWADKGKFFLPNSGTDKYGKDKPSAYRGFRDEALSHILTCYDILNEMDYTKQEPNLKLRVPIMTSKRKFVSCVQEELDPKKFENDAKNKLKTGL